MDYKAKCDICERKASFNYKKDKKAFVCQNCGFRALKTPDSPILQGLRRDLLLFDSP